jgi:hypothetical protein
LPREAPLGGAAGLGGLELLSVSKFVDHGIRKLTARLDEIDA